MKSRRTVGEEEGVTSMSENESKTLNTERNILCLTDGKTGAI